jgi:Tfp pilus assembly protein FimT
MRERKQNHRSPDWGRACAQRGFTTLELGVTVIVGMLLATSVVPLIRSELNFLKVRSAGSSVRGAIQSARSQAIFSGCPYAVTINKDSMTYQVSGQLAGATGCAAEFTNIGPAIPIAEAGAVTLNENVTIQVRPNGLTRTTLGAPTLVLNCRGITETVSVPKYGNISVTP